MTLPEEAPPAVEDADESRLVLPGALTEARALSILRGGEKCACELLDDLQISQPTLSHHMKILCDSGVVTCRREGKWSHYSISDVGSQRAVELLRAVTKIHSDASVLRDR